MLIAGEAHKGPPYKLTVHEAWDKIMAHLAVQLTESMQDLDMIRECTALMICI